MRDVAFAAPVSRFVSVSVGSRTALSSCVSVPRPKHGIFCCVFLFLNYHAHGGPATQNNTIANPVPARWAIPHQSITRGFEKRMQKTIQNSDGFRRFDMINRIWKYLGSYPSYVVCFLTNVSHFVLPVFFCSGGVMLCRVSWQATPAAEEK